MFFNQCDFENVIQSLGYFFSNSGSLLLSLLMFIAQVWGIASLFFLIISLECDCSDTCRTVSQCDIVVAIIAVY